MKSCFAVVGILAVVALAACGGTGHIASRPSPPPLAHSVSPIPFALVSRAGRQSATQLHASACARAATGNCAETLQLEPVTGPVPGGLSVVRPGERVRIAAGKPIGFVVGFARKLCSSSPLFGKHTDFHGLNWTIRLPPGRYAIDVSFFRPPSSGISSETGLFGLLVSRTNPLGIVRHPSC